MTIIGTHVCCPSVLLYQESIYSVYSVHSTGHYWWHSALGVQGGNVALGSFPPPWLLHVLISNARSPEPMIVLCVAEKPSISKSITNILSGGQFRTVSRIQRPNSVPTL